MDPSVPTSRTGPRLRARGGGPHMGSLCLPPATLILFYPTTYTSNLRDFSTSVLEVETKLSTFLSRKADLWGSLPSRRPSPPAISSHSAIESINNNATILYLWETLIMFLAMHIY